MSYESYRASCVAASLAALISICNQPAFAGATFSYDALGRIISVRYDDGKQITYQYDPAGNRTQHVTSATTINRQPLTVADAITIYENATQVSLDPRVNDSDPDGHPLTIYSAANGAFGTSAVTGGGTGWTYTTTIKRTASDVIAYVVADGQGQEASGSIVVTLANMNPVAANDASSVVKNQTKTLDPRVNDSDPGADTFKITSTSTPAHGAVVIELDGTQIKYTPTLNYVGADSFTYTITDIDGGTATATVNMTVTAS